ncbi:MAG: PTS mannose/fructose/sorbose transporter subunit IIB [Pseudonocardiales bacterium]|nr:MAG: PTS mannose/fructose/sorbose transporter subunit IIB [Pseudonocardiales bacterium]
MSANSATGNTAPVKHMRIDNRLIHGQVTVTWVGSIGATRLIVANDDVANDDFQRMLLPQAARGVATSVLSVDDTVAHCLGPDAENETIMIIAKFADDALRIVQGGVRPAEVNVGNQAPRPGTKFTMVTRSISVTAEEAETYRAIAAVGFDLQCKMMPTDRGENFLRLLEKKKL